MKKMISLIYIYQMVFSTKNPISEIEFIPKRPLTLPTIIKKVELPEQNSNGNNTPSHVLSYIKISDEDYFKFGKFQYRGVQTSFAWTRADIDLNNKIEKDIITQISAVKAFQISSDSKVIASPGFTGGDLVILKRSMDFSLKFPEIDFNSYQIRIRYAANTTTSIVIFGPELIYGIAPITTDRTNNKDFQYEDFQYVTFLNPFRVPSGGGSLVISLLGIPSDSFNIWIDKIEFIPITPQYLEIIEKEKLETIQQKMNDIFMDSQHQSLQIKTTDYEIDQIANEIETLSEDYYPQEKMMLLDEIKYAKQRSKSRNLLQNGDFASLDGWRTENDISVQTGNPIFKEYALHMPGARTTEINDTIFPTSLFQKIEEAKLKPYT
ncbi:delta endotoxin C-terminal domain-containing protein, partial [Bacillus thuringiensis]|uniref:delta endotoxin C-terminal domain-containing protein n=1 Tax=Bacillus thuringiensis TaxID=1428 RepID=UPI0023EF3423